VQNINGQVRIMIDGQLVDLSGAGKVVHPPRPNLLWTRATRAVALLESLGTPEARGILETVAGGEADAPPTQEARAALKRLKEAK
jgi:hypothetical protein